jgi:hypothetical protein
MSIVIHQPKEQARAQAATNPALALAVSKRPRAKKQKRKPNKAKPKPRQLPARLASTMKHVSECALMYASALMDPEGTSEGACVPYGFPTPSMKQKVFTRGTFQLGTSGQGFIIYNPVGANDAVAAITTTSTSVGTSSTQLGSFTNLTNVTLSKLMFNTADITSNKVCTWRYVAGGVKIRYAGTESGRNGTMCALEEQNHNLLSLRTGADMRGYINSFVERPDPLGSFFGVNYSGPINANDTQFSGQAGPSVNLSSGSNFIAIFVDGAAGDKYEFEIYHHVEYVGQNIPGVSASHADPELYAKAVETTKAVTVSQPLNDSNAKSTFRHFLEAAGTTIKGVLKQHGPDIIGMLSNALIPGSGYVTRGLLKGPGR